MVIPTVCPLVNNIAIENPPLVVEWPIKNGKFPVRKRLVYLRLSLVLEGIWTPIGLHCRCCRDCRGSACPLGHVTSRCRWPGPQLLLQLDHDLMRWKKTGKSWEIWRKTWKVPWLMPVFEWEKMVTPLRISLGWNIYRKPWLVSPQHVEVSCNLSLPSNLGLLT